MTALQSARDRLILAVDTSSLEEARTLVDELHDSVGIFKIGLQLLSNVGPAALDVFVAQGLQVFADTKFHDIPNTVEKAAAGIGGHGVAMFTVMASGGSRMLAGAVRGAQQGAEKIGKPAPMVLAVTVLTSLNQQALNDELRVQMPVEEYVLHLGALARDAGVTGIVASADEVAQLRGALGPHIKLITPGVRPTWASADDQARIVTPLDAIKRGADYIVVGRPITGAANKKEAAARIIDEIASAPAIS